MSRARGWLPAWHHVPERGGCPPSLSPHPTSPVSGIVGAGLLDANKPPENISLNMTSVLAVYSMLFMRFAWMVKPRNYLLLSCHASNEGVQLYQLQRKLAFDAAGGAAGAAGAAGAGGAAAPMK